MGSRTYTDEQLAAAVAASGSWRGVVRELGLKSASAAVLRSVRRAADDLSLDHSHFRGQRKWTDRELVDAVEKATTWTEVAASLSLRGGSWATTLRGHAARLGIDARHLDAVPLRRGTTSASPDLALLRRAGPMMAAAWFTLCGYDVAWPLEPCAYDLVVWQGGCSQRVQVKTTTRRDGATWNVRITRSGRGATPYDLADVDAFFIIDGDLRYYLLPASVVGGFSTINVNAYASYRLEQVPTVT